MKKLIAALLCTVLLLSACQSQAPGKGKIIRYDLPEPILTLDPQFATDAYSRMIIANIYEGLMAYDENGGLTTGTAESFELSADKKTLSFKLREGEQWKDGNPVTSDDFVFAFRRMFSPDSPSPFAKDYIAIANAEKVMENTLPPSMLGVTAKSGYELEITLEHPSPFFPALLAETPAMPCNRQAFDDARGRYGLEKDLVSSNGPFYLERWDNGTTIRLMPNTNDMSKNAASAGGVYLRVAPDESPIDRLLAGNSDVAVLSYDDAEKAKAKEFTAAEFQDTVWCIVFNQDSDILGNPLLRQGMAHTIEYKLFDQLPEKLVPTNLLVPPSSMLANAKYRDVSTASPIGFDPEKGRRLFETGIAALSIDNINGINFYMPDSFDHILASNVVQQSWQKHLSAYVNMNPVPFEDIERRFASGDYDILLMPVTAENPSAVDFLSGFKSDSRKNRFGYQNELYDSILSEVAAAQTLEEAGAACARAESMLLQDAVVIPVYFETKAFTAIPGLKGINPTLYPSSLNFKYAEK